MHRGSTTIAWIAVAALASCTRDRAGGTGDRPDGAADVYELLEDGSLDVSAADGVLANDGDSGGSGSGCILDTGPAHGALDLEPDGSFSYAPDPDFHGVDTFAYRRTSGSSRSEPVAVALVVVPVADPWARSIGEDDTAYGFFGGPIFGSVVLGSVRETDDHGYVVLATTTVDDTDAWIAKLAEDGAVAWQKRFVGSGYDWPSQAIQTADGGYLVVGTTDSFGAGWYDLWIVRLDSDGDVLWQRTYGGSSVSGGNAVVATDDGGFLVAGHTRLGFGDLDGDGWVVKLDPGGAVEWENAHGGAFADTFTGIAPTADGHFLLSGTFGYGSTNTDFWVVKLHPSGSIAWQRTYGGSGIETMGGGAASPAGDDGFVLAGTRGTSGLSDAWVIKIDREGGLVWQRSYGLPGAQVGNAIEPSSDGGFWVVGSTTRERVPGLGEWKDAWILKLDAAGDLESQRAVGGPLDDVGFAAARTYDRGLAVLGYGSFTAAYGVWLLRLGSDGTVPLEESVSGVSMLVTTASVATTAVAATESFVPLVATNVAVADTSVVPEATETHVETQSGSVLATLAAPTSLTATPGTEYVSIELGWTHPSADELGFVVFRSTDGVSFFRAGATGPGGTQYIDYGVDSGTSYTYKVEAFSAQGYGPFSSTASAVAP